MALASRIYFNAVFGAVGGLLGWLLFGILGDKTAPDDRVQAQLALGGAVVGGAVGYFVVAADALRDRSLLRFVRLASYGLVLGAAGGALGMLVGDWVHFRLVASVGAGRGTGALLGNMLARGLGWTLLGVAVGVGEGVAARSLGKLSYGTLGGALGGFAGGALFGLAVELTRGRGEQSPLWGALGLMVLGASIGSLSALVQAVLQPASVRVLRGWQEGREYGLARDENVVGRDEHADVALFRDSRVEKLHAVIRRDGRRYLLRNTGAPAEWTRVNGEPVADARELHDGDRIELGDVALRFQLREAKGRAKPARRR
jgi:hypothetical protein